MLFEIELPPGETVKFIKEDTDTEIKKYYTEYKELQGKTRDMAASDIEMKYIF